LQTKQGVKHDTRDYCCTSDQEAVDREEEDSTPGRPE